MASQGVPLDVDFRFIDTPISPPVVNLIVRISAIAGTWPGFPGPRRGSVKPALRAIPIKREGRYEKDGEELEHKEHGNMPEWAEDDPGKYWEAADEHERANGRLYSEVQFALPKELGDAERRELAGEFAERVCFQERLPYTLAIHRGGAKRREPPRAPDVLGAGP